MQQPSFFLNKQAYHSPSTIVMLNAVPLIASSFCLVLPSAILPQLAEHFQIPDLEDQLATIATIYFLTHAFTPLLSGCLRDLLGDRFALLFLNSTCVVGQLVVSLAVEMRSITMFAVGRVLLGWGVESLLIVLTSFITPYYRDGYLTFMLGVYQWLYTLGFVFGIWFAPGIQNVFLVNIGALTLQLIGLLTSVMAVQIDSRVEQELLAAPNPKFFTRNRSVQSLTQEILQLYDEQEIQIDEPRDREERKSQENQLQNPEPEAGFWANFLGLQEVFKFPRLFWLLLGFYAFASTSILVLVDFAPAFLAKHFLTEIENPERLAWKLVNLMWVITGSATPLFGFVVDRYGQRSSMTIFSGLMCVCSHILILVHQPYDGLLLLGFAFALSYTTVWSAVLYLTAADEHGKGLGLVVGLQNLGIALTPLLSNQLIKLTNTLIFSELLLLLIATMGFVMALLIYKERSRDILMIDRGIYVMEEKSGIYSEDSKKKSI